MVSRIWTVLPFLLLGACGTPPEDVAKIKANLLVGTEDGKPVYQTTTEVGSSKGSAEKKAAKFQRRPYLIATVCPEGSEIKDISVSDAYTRIVPGTAITNAYRMATIKFSCL
ncbi:MAG: hypothetical protein AAF231_10100 [Pseudomonadota bacterium]